MGQIMTRRAVKMKSRRNKPGYTVRRRTDDFRVSLIKIEGERERETLPFDFLFISASRKFCHPHDAKKICDS